MAADRVLKNSGESTRIRTSTRSCEKLSKARTDRSIPRSAKETDHNFAEPGLLVINSDGEVQVVDLSNNPFARPDLEVLVSGLEWIRKPENNYPIRGTFA